MARSCTVCRHERLREIDQALVAGQSRRAVGAKYGVSPDSVKRHAAAHLPVQAVQRQALSEAQEGLDLTRQLAAINAAALAILDEARKAGRPETALRAIDRVVKTLEVQVKVLETQELEDRIKALEEQRATLPQPQRGVRPWR